MKKLFLYLILLISGSCQPKEEPVELPQCTCLDYEVKPDSTIYRGRIIFHKTYTMYPYSIEEFDKRLVYGFTSDRRAIICGDSTLENLLILAQIKDSMLVQFKCSLVKQSFVKNGINCNINSNSSGLRINSTPVNIIRIVEIDKQ